MLPIVVQFFLYFLQGDEKIEMELKLTDSNNVHIFKLLFNTEIYAAIIML